MICPLCEADMDRVIYYGLPMWLCPIQSCNCVAGFWSWIAEVLPFNGYFMAYDGWYPPALWTWLTGGAE